uniref:Uncharacterized protein n=1 Tax=Brassica campestris TaxID=3711 RepID=A0A3P6DWZ1_BRACM|nr:unnamed protein product [Brassica rapa]
MRKSFLMGELGSRCKDVKLQNAIAEYRKPEKNIPCLMSVEERVFKKKK